MGKNFVFTTDPPSVFLLLFGTKKEVIETVSIGGHGKHCFEIGGSERGGDFRVSKGRNGKKEYFHGGTAYVH